MWELAVEAGQPPSEALTVAVWTFYGVVVTAVLSALALIATQFIKSRSERVPATAPAAPDATQLMQIARDMGALSQRADDADERDEVQDRRLENHTDRLEALERYHDLRDPNWRRG